jgi:ppGpp synthetase/RelA/SpoT-type nucleotidyltranferase
MGQYSEWHHAQCEAYKIEIPIYQQYATTLELILKAACRVYAPLGIVQTRAKPFASFAEKMARKAPKYTALGIGPTDLCGARIITETQAEVDRVCDWIRRAFEIDQANSIDVRTRLKAAEFGYLSVHYVVQFKGTELLGVPIPPEIGERKAEIQVRTLLQHAWASISHDRVYKASFRVPEHLSRDLARVAAFLEEADDQFGGAIRALDTYKIHYGVHMDQKRLEEEIEVLETVLASEPDLTRRPAGALRLAQVARATGDWTRVEGLLAPYKDVAGDYQLEVLAEHGHALCRLHEERPQEAAFGQGRAEIEQATHQAQGALQTRALAYRAWASARIPDNEEESRKHYRAAFEADPQNPFHLASHVEYEMYCGEPLGLRAVSRPALEAAIRTCRSYADVGIELPWAYLTMGRLHLLLDEPYESLAAYAKAIRHCHQNKKCVPEAVLDGELTFLRRINRARPMPETHLWVRHQLQLAKAARGGEVTGLEPQHRAFTPPVVILAGGTSAGSQPDIDAARATVLRAFEGFQGTIISGGTNAGVAGLAGELAEQLRASGAQVIGYVPRHMPYDQPIDRRYTEHVASEGASYGAGSPLQYWTDLLRAGVNPADVRVVAIDGGRIAAFEYRLALALGASVGLVAPVTRSAANLHVDPDWRSENGLILLPRDPMVLRAFAEAPRPALGTDEIDAVARRIHENFLAANRYKNPDRAMKPFDELGDDLKASNRKQAESAAAFLERIGYRVERATGPVTPLVLSDTEVDRLAEMEHGRWVVERLESGWRHGAKRDPAKQESPHLIPWLELSEDVKGWDRDAVRAWPDMLGGLGLQVGRA